MLSSKKPYKVKLHGRAGLTYWEGPRSMLIDSGMLTGPQFDMVIYLDSIKNWLPPHDNEPLTKADKLRIKENLAKELKSAKIDWQ